MCECEKKETRNYYRYYDTPDGCDVMKKTFVTTRYGVITGLIFSTYDVLMYSRVVGLRPVMRRYMLHTVPLGLMGATFAVVANGALKFRDTDDVWNYFLGGLACGPILGAYLGSKHAILLGGLALGVMGVIKKDSVDDGYQLFPPVRGHMNTINGHRRDYSRLVDPREDMQHTCE